MVANRCLYLTSPERERIHDIAWGLWSCRDRIEDSDDNHLPLRDDERQAIKPLLDSGYEISGVGIARIVLRMAPDGGMDDFVVKLGRYGDEPTSIGMWQNREEVALWNDVGTDWPLLPVCDWQEGAIRWLIMPYGTPLDDDSFTEEKRESLVATGVEELSGLDVLQEIEFEPVNFVYWCDSVWFADYGRQSGL